MIFPCVWFNSALGSELPLDKLGLFSNATFRWLNEYLYAGYKNGMKDKTLPSLSQRETCNVNGPRCVMCIKRKISLQWTIIAGFDHSSCSLQKSLFSRMKLLDSQSLSLGWMFFSLVFFFLTGASMDVKLPCTNFWKWWTVWFTETWLLIMTRKKYSFFVGDDTGILWVLTSLILVLK